jgi:sulfide:quinone oxidoreductase
MAHVVILGGGFAGVVAAEKLAKRLSSEHQITLLSRTNRFVFYPALVRLAFGSADVGDISFDLRDTLLEKRIRFVTGEVARIDPELKRVIVAHGEVQGDLNYDYLLIALGRRLATENITGFYEYAHHLLTTDDAKRFGDAVRSFKTGRAVIGQCPGARLPVPVYETAFALARTFEKGPDQGARRITIISPDPPESQFGDGDFMLALRNALEAHEIEYLPDFRVQSVSPAAVIADDGHSLNYGLLMLLPPFRGPSAVLGLGISDDEGYINVDRTMRVQGAAEMYAAGDCVNFEGPKLGHMAVHQAEVAAENLAAEIQGKRPVAQYDHEMMMVIDEAGGETIFLKKALWGDKPSQVKQGQFWSWAKRIHEKYWKYRHS